MPDLGKDKDKLLEVIGEYDGLAIRSATKVTEKVIAPPTNLKVIGRAGIGVDNVDIPAASKKGVIVMNTPFGNSITTAEHAIAMMFAVARQIPEAERLDPCRQVGEIEIHGRRDHRQDARRHRRRQYRRHRLRPRPRPRMKVIAYDPFLSEERADQMGVTRSSSTSC
jgi:D-3-phosphoglycerate dehydrogenase